MAAVGAATLTPAPALADTTRPNCADCLVYVVKRGDTLIALSRDYLVGTSAWHELRTINRVADPERLPIGLRLNVPRRLIRFVPVTLRVASFTGAVTIGPSRQPVMASKGQIVPEGSTVTTGINGFVALLGEDGSRLALPSNTRVRLVRARRYALFNSPDIEVAVEQGRTEVRAAKQPPQGRFRVRTPVAVSAVRGTIFRAGFVDAAKLALTEVLEGNVGVASSGDEKVLPAGIGAATNASGAIATESLLSAPALNRPTKVQTDEQLVFSLVPVSGARAYRVQIARDAGFVELLSEAETDATTVIMPETGNGRFYLRTAAISSSGLAGMEETWSFRRQRVGLTASVGAGSSTDAFRFKWLAVGEGTSSFDFQLVRADPEAVPIVDEAGLTTTGLELTKLNPGKYLWRVGVVQTTTDGSVRVWTPFETLNVGN